MIRVFEESYLPKDRIKDTTLTKRRPTCDWHFDASVLLNREFSCGFGRATRQMAITWQILLQEFNRNDYYHNNRW